MPLQKLQFRPGLIKDVSSYTNEGGWFDCNMVRFRNGFPQSVGGWQKYATTQFLGICRELNNWIALNGANYLGIGTTCKFYIESGQEFFDITPIRETAVLTNPFTATNGSATINVYDVNHGAFTGDYVTFSGATGLGGNITAAVLNKEYQIAFVVDADNYQITASATASPSDTGNGGTVTAAYQINSGLDTQVGGTGWGAGTWGRGGWGSATTLSVGNTLRLWTSDNFGEDLIFNVRDGGIYYWDATTGTGVRGVALNSLSSDPSCPTIATQIIVSDNDRHVIAFGPNNFINNDGSINPLQDPLLIRFSTQEDPTVWTPTATNSAGDLRLGAGTHIIRAIETKREILVWTDLSLYSLQFLGPPYTFGINPIASNITSIGYNCYATVEDNVFWMGMGKFYIYNGRTDELPCPIKNHVFTNINMDETDKVYAAVNSEFNEITWFYPTANSSENNVYVTYNYAEKAWSYGTLARTAWLDRGTNQYPIAASPDRYLYNQELGTDDGSANPPVAINAYIESSPFDIGEGEQFSFIRRIIPDLTFINSTDSPQATMTLKMQQFTGSNYSSSNSGTVTQTATIPVEQFTTQIYTRLRGRQVTFRVESNKVGTRWSLGSPRIDIQPDGRR
jgi:hypothetical protein